MKHDIKQAYSLRMMFIIPISQLLLLISMEPYVMILVFSGRVPLSGLHVSNFDASHVSIHSHTCFQFAELSNFHTHLTLRALRPVGSRKRGIPFGYGFNLVTCPNYMFE